jgi:hypothetical protein
MRASRDLGLGAHDALRDRRRGHQEPVRDRLGGQPADLAQRQRDLRVGGECRVAAGEDEAQPIGLERRIVGLGCCKGLDALDMIVLRLEACASPNPVDRLESAGRDEPGRRVCRQTFARPLLERRADGVVQRFFGELEVAQQADQRGEHAARLAAVDRLDVDRGTRTAKPFDKLRQASYRGGLRLASRSNPSAGIHAGLCGPP